MVQKHVFLSLAGADIPVVLLVFSAGPVNISFADRDPRVDAIIQCFFPAQATGEALYNMITSAEYSPAGRLPYTWYDTADQVRSSQQYSHTSFNIYILPDKLYVYYHCIA